MAQKDSIVPNNPDCKVVVLECYQAGDCLHLHTHLESGGYQVYRGCDPEAPAEAHRIHLDIPCLTVREIEILRAVGNCARQAQAANELCIGEKSLRTSLSEIRRKLNVQSTHQALLWACKKGLI